VHSADRTRRHLISQPPSHRVSGLCNHPRSSAPGLLLLSWSSSLHTMPHLPSAHHERSKRDSPNETKIKEKQNKTIPDLNSKLTKSMTHHNQIKEWTTWFLRWALLNLRHRLTRGPLSTFLRSMVGAPGSLVLSPRGAAIDVFCVQWWTLLDLRHHLPGGPPSTFFMLNGGCSWISDITS
jgi:hypothetical protein